MTRPLEDRYIVTEPELKDRLTFALGGRVAEELVFQEISTGASDDLQRATEIARAMVVEFGMSEKLGPVAFGQNGFRSREGRPLFPGEGPEMSDETARVVDEEVSRLINEARDTAHAILQADRAMLDQLSLVLIYREVLDGKDLQAYLSGEQPIPNEDELKAEAAAKASENGQKALASGPEILSSSAAGEEIPARPD
jgi:cell division protease FtsH